HCRKHIRQALNKGVSYRITEKPEDLHDFKKIYYATMDRNEAGDYYYFDDAYFDACIRDFKDNLLLVEAVFEERTIAAGMYFLYGDLMHIHLSGTLNEYLYLSPAYILRYALATYGKEHGYKMIHHGGGRSNSPEDSLYLFKEQFAQNTKFDFYIARKKWIPDVYSAICKKANVSEDIPYFPAYRSVGH
nr:GNAT family N-acetyltransferase [Lachnospiraceae bacterium]